jgi:predicted transcriptional regulator
MRTTVEIRDEHRARLLELAARRGEKGFSSLIEEALEQYLEQQGQHQDLLSNALAARGSLSQDEVTDLRARATVLRETWR